MSREQLFGCTLEQAKSHLEHDVMNACVEYDETTKKAWVHSEPWLDDLVALLVVMESKNAPTAKDYYSTMRKVELPNKEKYSDRAIPPFDLSELQAWEILYEYHDRKDLIMDIVFSPGKGGRTWVDDMEEPQLVEALAVLCYKESGIMPTYYNGED